MLWVRTMQQLLLLLNLLQLSSCNQQSYINLRPDKAPDVSTDDGHPEALLQQPDPDSSKRRRTVVYKGYAATALLTVSESPPAPESEAFAHCISPPVTEDAVLDRAFL